MEVPMANWTVPSHDGRVILGTTHEPAAGPVQGQVLIAHGFKGYKDYGFIPWLAETLAKSGLAAHRFNFSCCGMDHGHGEFDIQAFRRDTWNTQVEDVLCLIRAAHLGQLPGGSGPIVLAGHSRGGVASLLAAGRHAGSGRLEGLRGILSMASPDRCLSMDAAMQAKLLSEGTISSPSSRTSQVLQIGRAFLEEQLTDPSGHDLLLQTGRVDLPICVVHGTADDAVAIESAMSISEAAAGSCRVHRIEDANHVFNTPNPFSQDATPSEALSRLGSIACSFARELGLRRA
jgi:predicted alpha/beta-hydrolase family hydrolase